MYTTSTRKARSRHSDVSGAMVLRSRRVEQSLKFHHGKPHALGGAPPGRMEDRNPHPISVSQESIGASHAGGTKTIQRNVGIEVELTSGDHEKGMALEPHENENWCKRDSMYTEDTWTLTLDDTPGSDKYDGHGRIWTCIEEAEAGEKIGKGPFRKYNLEFILHGGGNRRGFKNDDLDGMKAAMDRIGEYCKKEEYPANVETKNRNGGLLHLHRPTKGLESVNIQVTAGASLAGLHRLLEGLFENGDCEYLEGENCLDPLVLGNVHQTNLCQAFVPYKSVEDVYEGKEYDKPQFKRAFRAIAGMLTLVRTFLQNHSDAMVKQNIKEATPILWKTPLNMVFRSVDVEGCAESIKSRWVELIERLFSSYRSTYIWHRPGSKLSVYKWLRELPDRDWLALADNSYDRSFGGIGHLETGDGPSKGQPILEFRSMPLSLSRFKEGLEKTLKTLEEVNDPAFAGAGSSISSSASSHSG